MSYEYFVCHTRYSAYVCFYHNFKTFGKFIHYGPRLCTYQIRVGSTLKTQEIHTAFSTGISHISQSKLVTNNALNCSVRHLPVYQSIKRIYHRISTKFCIEMHWCIVHQYKNDKCIRRLKSILKQNKALL